MDTKQPIPQAMRASLEAVQIWDRGFKVAAVRCFGKLFTCKETDNLVYVINQSDGRVDILPKGKTDKNNSTVALALCLDKQKPVSTRSFYERQFKRYY